MPCTELECRQCHDGDRGEITYEHEKVEGLLLPSDAAFLGPFTCYLYGYKLRSRNMPPHISCATLRTVCNAVLVRHAPRAAARTMAQPN